MEQAVTKKRPLKMISFRNRQTGRGLIMSGEAFHRALAPESMRRAHRGTIAKHALGTGIPGAALGGLVGGRAGALFVGGVGTAWGGVHGHLRARRANRALKGIQRNLRERGFDV